MYARNHEEILVVGGVHLGSIVADITMLCLHGSDWSGAGHEVAFGMSMMIINLFAKLAAMGILFMVYEEISGGAFIPTRRNKDFSQIGENKDAADETGGSYQND
eukprot:CAMPEP_0184484806 /NCGR_PEP_ID=MMETSP0113_2-20130426/6483_1 /TAXON_ID=91329 /ORGANISM="Norrisiella sphaerica, Strain BC52" /LENGTH=103 /DNA_ID=CAMNT_0026865955 /DNA_START=284 /DNA_END=595 /DNA_ORIENTATION=-